MKLDEFVRTAQDAITVKRVYGDPYEKDGVAIITAATVGGGGGGGGHDEKGHDGEGGGFGVSAKPAGAYIIKKGKVRWRPAVNVNKLLMTVGAVAIVYMITRASVEKARMRAAVADLTQTGDH